MENLNLVTQFDDKVEILDESVKHHKDLLSDFKINNSFEVIKVITQYQIILGEKVLDLAQVFPSNKEMYSGVCGDWQSQAYREMLLLTCEDILNHVSTNVSKYEVTNDSKIRIAHIARTAMEAGLENKKLDLFYSGLVIVEPHPIALITSLRKGILTTFRAPMGAAAEELLHKGLADNINKILDILR